MITAEQKAAWLAALRSGEYQQGRGCLKKTFWGNGAPCYCCLGVLAETVEPDCFKFPPNEDGHFAYRGWSDKYLQNFIGHYKLLPQHIQNKLANMNDIDRAGFAQIADWIEANIPADEEPQP